MIKVMLYSQKGEAGANAEDRWMRYDPYTLDLTIADDPVNLGRVRRFMEALNSKALESPKASDSTRKP